jgi:hypothetical protein
MGKIDMVEVTLAFAPGARLARRATPGFIQPQDLELFCKPHHCPSGKQI